MNDVDKLARETCLNAAEYISTHGWFQGAMFGTPTDDQRTFGRGRASACAVGALTMSSPMNFQHQPITGRAIALVQETLGLDKGMPGALPEWNDDPCRTAEDVILALKRAGTE